MDDTEARTAIITGAARGIGLETARHFADAGWQVAMLDILGDQVAREAGEIGADRATAFDCDVSDAEQVNRTVAAIASRFGRLDALVNNAGVADFSPALDTSLETWTRIMAVNLTGPFLTTQAAAPHMIAAGQGAIVNITSISGLRASTLRIAYGTSKAALAHLTRQYAAEFGEHGIRVNAVAPGPVDTAMAKKVHSPEIRAAYRDAMPLSRYATEEEIAAVILFLCSPESSFVTGQVVAVDGGFDAVGIGLGDLPTRAGTKRTR